MPKPSQPTTTSHSHGPASSAKFLFRRDARWMGKCAGCGQIINPGMAMIYDPEEKQMMCEDCGTDYAAETGTEIR